jgi:hypothetical protein
MITNFLKSSLSWLISQLAISIVVWILYLTLLQDLLEVRMTLLNWIGTVLIMSLIFPAGRPVVRENKEITSKNNLHDLISNGRQGN